MANKKKQIATDLAVVDNFLEEDLFKEVKEAFFHSDTHWHFTPNISDNDSTNALKNPLNNYYFTHLLYKEYESFSSFTRRFMEIMIPPLSQKLGFKFNAITRIKANMYPRTETLQVHPWHVDSNEKTQMGALLMMNTCDGFTGFSDGTQVDTIENRMVLFDATERHHSTNCTNDQFRMTININYV